MLVLRFKLFVLALPVAVGCGSQPDLMPLKVGRETTYAVQLGLDSKIEPVKVVRQVPVAGVTGYELSGPLGVTRLAWKEGVLLADSTSNARFSPPLPILAADGKNRSWRGTVESMGKAQDATAELTHEKAELPLGTKKVDTTLATVKLKLPKADLELRSWFQEGVGLVQQEQQTGIAVVVRLEMVGSPRDISSTR